MVLDARRDALSKLGWRRPLDVDDENLRRSPQPDRRSGKEGTPT